MLVKVRLLRHNGRLLRRDEQIDKPAFVGNLSVMVHPMLNESPVWSGIMMSLHPAAVTKVWLRRTFTQETDQRGAASNLRDATAGAITSELTVKYAVESTAAMMEDITVDHYTV